MPEVLISDNGLQYSSVEFAEFTRNYGFTHAMSSPEYPRANGAAECSVQMLKGILQKAEDPYKALLAYRSTPLENGYSPAELLFGRRIRSTILALPESLLPKLPDMGGLWKKEAAYSDRIKVNYDRRNRAMPQQPLYPGTPVWMRDMERPGIVKQALDQPLSYLVETEKGSLRCNRSQLTDDPVVMMFAAETASPVPPEAALHRPNRRTTKTQRLIETIKIWGHIMDIPDT